MIFVACFFSKTVADDLSHSSKKLAGNMQEIIRTVPHFGKVSIIDKRFIRSFPDGGYMAMRHEHALVSI